MVVDKELMALSDVAKLCGTSNSNVSNWRARDSKFPVPYTETSAGPIWKSEDIVAYLQQKNEVDVISTGNLKSKRIAIIGRARGGKSFFNSRFVADKSGFVNLFCGNSSDKTACPINVKISEAVTIESYIFHSDFNSKYPEGDTDIDPIREKVSALVDHSFLQDDVSKMEEIESLIREIVKIEEEKGKKTRTYIDTYQKPSTFCKELLRECGLGSIEIIDTPGVSGNVEAARTAKSDIYLFLIKPDNSDESLTLKRIVTTIKADVATSKVAFLYKKEGFFITQKKYQDAKETVKKDMEAYSELFADLKGSIVSTELDILDPAAHCILFPTMDPDDVTLPEELFLKDMKEKLVVAFSPNDDKKNDDEFAKLIKEYGEAANNLVLSIMSNIPTHDFLRGANAYTEEELSGEQHDRVMTKDNYRIRNDLDYVYNEEIKLLDTYFSSFVATEYPNEWEQKIIKYVYRKLMHSVRTDRGLGVGSHPWEERPARTMLVEESLIADKILSKVLAEEDWKRNEPYRKAFRENNITSATWNCVGCVSDSEAIKKLQIIEACLLDVPVTTRKGMILCRYIGGLRKTAQYRILSLMGYSEKECMEQVKKFPF